MRKVPFRGALACVNAAGGLRWQEIDVPLAIHLPKLAVDRDRAVAQGKNDQERRFSVPLGP